MDALFSSVVVELLPVPRARTKLARRTPPGNRTYRYLPNHLQYTDNTPDLMTISEETFLSELSDVITPDPNSNSQPEDHETEVLQRLSRRSEAYHSAKREFLGNPDNYIPLGSITIVPDESEGPDLPDGWDESGKSPKRVHKSLPIYGLLEVLLCHDIIRVLTRRHQRLHKRVTVRVYVLPDDVGRRFVDRWDPAPRDCLKKLTPLLDPSSESWEGRNESMNLLQGEAQEQPHLDSLFYIFNTLPSPSPRIADVSCSTAKAAMGSLLDLQIMPGLKTPLYPYQKRSAAEMIRRETAPSRKPDPRFQVIEGPTGRPFYYDGATGMLLRDRQEYEEARGGILAETMGQGKTMICLATILATKGHWPRIPPEHSLGLYPIRPRVGTLMQMVASTIGREQIAWKPHFQSLARSGSNHARCVAMLEENIGRYIIPNPTTRGRAQTVVSPGQEIHLCSATLVIVPPNLFLQWQSEMTKHLEEDVLEVLLMDSLNEEIPSSLELRSYDLILMSKNRFDREMRKGHHSPLKDLHFLRLIVDEGHAFAASGRNSASIRALQSIHVERRWVVSGTPATSLLGVEVSLAANETSQEQPVNSQRANQAALAARKKAGSIKEECMTLKALKNMVTDFFCVRPWANPKGSDYASWQKYVDPTASCRGKSTSLRSILEGLVVRHQIEAVENDIQLPPLYNRVVHLQPSWHDKISINLFVLTLTANAVTSEREGKDYMFHPANRSQLDKVISNLRQSGFYWTSFSSKDVRKTLEICERYLEKTAGYHLPVNVEDRARMVGAMKIGRFALESNSWKALSEFNELGIYVEGFPEDASETWSFIPKNAEAPLLIGATQLIEAQEYVESRLYDPYPFTGLAALGTWTMEKTRHSAVDKAGERGSRWKNMISKAEVNPHRPKPRNAQKAKATSHTEHISTLNSLKSALKSSTIEPLHLNSHHAKTKITGTASAKLSYLLSRVVALQQVEKILVFYEGDQIAFYIAQAFDLVKIQYRIYAGTLTIAQRNSYIAIFNDTETCRVLLMDVRQAAHGLHLASASRVFFVNPVWQPNVEAQAIKRAHRIGQIRPVYVETLVLQDTLEDQMLQRRKGMTTEEHQTAKNSMLDDPKVGAMIQNAEPIPVTQDEVLEVRKQMAPLERPQRLFGHGDNAISAHDTLDAHLLLRENQAAPPRSRKRNRADSSPSWGSKPQKKVAFSIDDESMADSFDQRLVFRS